MNNNIKEALDAGRLHHQLYPEFAEAEEFIYDVKIRIQTFN